VIRQYSIADNTKLRSVNMTDLTTIGTGWEILSSCGRPITEAFAAKWFAGKVKGEWVQSKPLGLGARIDHLRRITSLHLYSAGAESGFKAFADPLPGDLAFAMPRTTVHALFGPPTASGDPQGEPSSIFYSPYPWDRWDMPSKGGIRVEYREDSLSIRMITLSEPQLPEATSVELQIYADYYQFYVADLASTCDTGEIWNDEASSRQFACGDGLVAVGTKRYGTVPVRIENYPIEPKLDPRGIDRINECTLTISTKLGVGNYISSADLTPVDISPGMYGVRVLYIHQDQVENDEKGNDQYVVQLWPVAEPLPLRYIKPAEKTRAATPKALKSPRKKPRNTKP
jgi:hypothetical protein